MFVCTMNHPECSHLHSPARDCDWRQYIEHKFYLELQLFNLISILAEHTHDPPYVDSRLK